MRVIGPHHDTTLAHGDRLICDAKGVRQRVLDQQHGRIGRAGSGTDSLKLTHAQGRGESGRRLIQHNQSGVPEKDQRRRQRLPFSAGKEPCATRKEGLELGVVVKRLRHGVIRKPRTAGGKVQVVLH